MSKYFLPNDYARCDNERCDKRNSCARYLDILPFDGYFYCGFNENDCDFYLAWYKTKKEEEMTEFRKGDTVRIKDGFNPEEHRGRDGFAWAMDKYIGKDFDVDKVEDGYIISDGWAFNPDWLELVERKATAEEAEQAESVFLGDTLLQDTMDVIMGSGSFWFGKPIHLGKNEESILQEAQRIVNGERQADYSDPVKNFEHIARIASAILNKEITPEECCIVMIAVKHAREQFKHKRDNLVDLAGYEEILYRIKEAKK